MMQHTFDVTGESNQGFDVFYVVETVVIRLHHVIQCAQMDQIYFVVRRRLQFFRDRGPVVGQIHVHDHSDPRIRG